MNGVTAAITRTKRASHTGHRRAFGPGKARTPAQRAADVAASIAQRNDAGDGWDWSSYGLDGVNDWAQRRLVEAALAHLTWTREEETRLAAHAYEEEHARLEDWERAEELENDGRERQPGALRGALQERERTMITIFDEILTGNMGDGWRDDREAADAYAAFLADALRTYVEQCYPDETVEVRITVQRASGVSRGLDVIADLSGGEDLRLREALAAVAGKAWEDFCGSEEAHALFQTD